MPLLYKFLWSYNFTHCYYIIYFLIEYKLYFIFKSSVTILVHYIFFKIIDYIISYTDIIIKVSQKKEKEEEEEDTIIINA